MHADTANIYTVDIHIVNKW